MSGRPRRSNRLRFGDPSASGNSRGESAGWTIIESVLACSSGMGLELRETGLGSLETRLDSQETELESWEARLDSQETELESWDSQETGLDLLEIGLGLRETGLASRVTGLVSIENSSCFMMVASGMVSTTSSKIAGTLASSHTTGRATSLIKSMVADFVAAAEDSACLGSSTIVGDPVTDVKAIVIAVSNRATLIGEDLRCERAMCVGESGAESSSKTGRGLRRALTVEGSRGEDPKTGSGAGVTFLFDRDTDLGTGMALLVASTGAVFARRRANGPDCVSGLTDSGDDGTGFLADITEEERGRPEAFAGVSGVLLSPDGDLTDGFRGGDGDTFRVTRTD